MSRPLTIYFSNFTKTLRQLAEEPFACQHSSHQALFNGFNNGVSTQLPGHILEFCCCVFLIVWNPLNKVPHQACGALFGGRSLLTFCPKCGTYLRAVLIQGGVYSSEIKYIHLKLHGHFKPSSSSYMYLSVRKAQIKCLAFFDISMSSGNCSEFLWSIIFPVEREKWRSDGWSFVTIMHSNVNFIRVSTMNNKKM